MREDRSPAETVETLELPGGAAVEVLDPPVGRDDRDGAQDEDR